MLYGAYVGNSITKGHLNFKAQFSLCACFNFSESTGCTFVQASNWVLLNPTLDECRKGLRDVKIKDNF